MADPTPMAAAQTRNWWAGPDADTDVHIEVYEGQIDASFQYNSIFRSGNLTTFKGVQGRSNTWRGDRIGGVRVQGRKSGEKLTPSRIINDKFVVVVDTTSFIRTAFDYQDDWTSPDFMADYSREHGIAHSKSFDEAHIIQLIKAGDWVAPADLKASGSFYDGIKAVATGYLAATDLEVKADLFVAKHAEVVAEFVKRDLGQYLGEMVTLVKPELFNVLLNHKKLMNVQFQGASIDGQNSFATRRVGYVNGVQVIETARFPYEVNAAHHLGPAFNVTTAMLKALAVVFLPSVTLVTVEGHPLVVQKWDDKDNFQTVLDSYQMYTVEVRRGDAAATIMSD